MNTWALRILRWAKDEVDKTLSESCSESSDTDSKSEPECTGDDTLAEADG